MSQDKLSAEDIVERILFGKGGSKSDYANDIKQLVKEQVERACKEQREICADLLVGHKQTGLGRLILSIKKEIRNAPQPE